MNRIFSTSGEGWPGFPTRSFARLDQTEPINPSESDEAEFAFDADAVDADWQGFAPGGAFDLSNPREARDRLRRFWSGMFAQKNRPDLDLFDEMPIYRIEVTSRRGDQFWEVLQGFDEGEWVTLQLARSGQVPVDVYGGILAAAVQAFLLSATKTNSSDSDALSEEFDVDMWPDADDTDIDQALSGRGTFESLVAYDVGQGAAIGLHDTKENALIFFDLGAGAYGNKKTRPNPLRFCWRKDPPVILSHWDTDHWAGETTDPLAASKTWIAPRQSGLGPTHHAFAGRILAAGGSLLIWGAAAKAQLNIAIATGQSLTLVRCTGTSRNGSGIAGLLESTKTGEAWLLTGDAGYHELSLSLPKQLSTIVVPHHGADMGTSSLAPTRPSGYTRLVYTFGPGNSHGRTKVSHPTSAAVSHHDSKGWSHGAWSLTTPALTVAGGDVLATAENPNGGSAGRHLESAACGWSATPTVPFTTVPCTAGAGSTTGCTCKINQA